MATSHSQLTGKAMNVEWGPNWDDNLAGGPETAMSDPLINGELANKVKMEYEQAFMFYLPRICEHCLNPSCVASCPSGAMYKREEDGIVLVDQDKCRGWRFCVSGCPYKKVYFNHKSGKAEKCTLCYPRIEAGQPTICSETCVGRIRYLGLLLYDADRVEAAASVADEHDLLDAQRGLFLDPADPDVRKRALADGISPDWIEHAQRSPVHALVARYKVALPLHPEYRTMPMVWYVPPLSPIVNALEGDGYEADPDDLFPAVDSMRIPLEYLANLLSAGDTDVIRDVLRKLAAMRGYMRKHQVLRPERREPPGRRRHDRARARGHVPAACDRQVRRALRHPPSPRRARRPPRRTGGGRRMQPRLRGRPRQLRSGRPGHKALVHADRAPGTAALLTAARTEGDPATSPTRRAGCRMSRSTPPCCIRSRHCCCATRPRRCSPPTPRSPPRWPNSPARALERSSSRFLTHRRALSLIDLEREYVETFDTRRRCTLNVSYYLYGDTRRRGVSLLRLKRLYAAAGLVLESDELPDHLPAMLEFAAFAPSGYGERVLHEHRIGLELLRLALRADERPQRDVLDAVCSALPRLGLRSPMRSDAWSPKAHPTSRSDSNLRPTRSHAHRGARMNALHLLLWVALPYIAITVFIAGHIWRYRTDQYGWTTRSTQLLESRKLKWGSILFHYGALAAIGGHVLGILVPASWTSAFGVSEHSYHLLSAAAGTLAGIACGAGFVILAWRRITSTRVRVTTSRMDIAVYAIARSGDRTRNRRDDRPKHARRRL